MHLRVCLTRISSIILSHIFIIHSVLSVWRGIIKLIYGVWQHTWLTICSIGILARLVIRFTSSTGIHIIISHYFNHIVIKCLLSLLLSSFNYLFQISIIIKVQKFFLYIISKPILKNKYNISQKKLTSMMSFRIFSTPWTSSGSSLGLKTIITYLIKKFTLFCV